MLQTRVSFDQNEWHAECGYFLMIEVIGWRVSLTLDRHTRDGVYTTFFLLYWLIFSSDVWVYAENGRRFLYKKKLKKEKKGEKQNFTIAANEFSHNFSNSKNCLSAFRHSSIIES